MALGRALSDHEPGRDLAVAQALGDQGEAVKARLDGAMEALRVALDRQIAARRSADPHAQPH